MFGVLGSPGNIQNYDLSADKTDKYQTGVRFRLVSRKNTCTIISPTSYGSYHMEHITGPLVYGGVFWVKSHYNSKVGNMVDTYKMCLNFAETGELEYISKGQIFFKVNFRRERIFVWRRYYSTNVHKIRTALSSMDWRIGPIVSLHTSERKLVKILPMHITSINIDTDINVN